MGKKQVAVSLRKPPPADPDAFVSGGANASSTVAITPQHAAEGPNVVTRVGERRELTVYLPTPLARQLAMRCVELDRDVSGLVAEALVKRLALDEPVPAALPAPVPADRWAKARVFVGQLRHRLPLLGLA